jgi:hypothetical protein
MKVFVFRLTSPQDRELLGEYDMQQIPAIGEKFVTRHDEGIQAWPVVGVRHFLTREAGVQGAFLDVGTSDVFNVPQEVAEMIAD